VAALVKDDEHRELPRSSFISFIWYKRLGDGAAEAPAEGLARSCDISEAGVGLVTPREIPAGALIFVEIATPEGGVSAVGRVMHSRALGNGAYRLGIQLEVVPPTDHAILAKLIEASK
jgi:hypothetical protein